MEKRVFLALFLSFLVLYGYQAFFVKPVPPPRPQPAATTSQPAAAPRAATSPAQPAAGEQTPAPPAAETLPAAVPVISDTAEREIKVDTKLVEAIFTTRGAALKNWRLKKYHDATGRALDLVPQNLAPSERPFLLHLDEAAITARANDALFRPSAPSVDATAQPATLTFDYEDQAGVRVSKTFRFEPESYSAALTVVASAGGRPVNPQVSMGAGLGDPSEALSRGLAPAGGLLFAAGEIERLSVSTIAKQNVYQGDLRFAGVEDLYFLSAAVAPPPVRVEYTPVAAPAPGAAPDAPAREFVKYRVGFAAPPSGARFYLGPKEFDVLAAIDRDLVRAIDFGIFAFLVVPLLRSLKWINGYVGNYGWSIVLLTVFINALMFPLRHKSVVSMRRMQELQPQVKAIQDRYGKLKATDPERQKMNTELMNLYREKGVNPASGCVPMLLTLPVLFAFYSLLAVAIEIRGEPFVGWIHDLSAPDPLYITPIVMAITMFIQQKMTPTTADPVQQKMMLMMPLVMGVMFLNFSSGLVLYWLVSNLWAIGQQYVTNRIIGPPVVRPARPPAERRVKPAANPSSQQR